MNMFPFLKSRRKKHEIQIIDLTIGSTLEDDYILPTKLIRELSIRGIRANCTPIVAEQRIADWEQEYSIQSIRNSISEEDWELVIDLCINRISVYEETEPLIHLIRTYYRLEMFDACMNKCEELLQVEHDNINAKRFIARCFRNLGENDKAIEAYLQILNLHCDDHDSIFSLVRIYYNLKDYSKLIIYSKKMIELNPDSIDGIRFYSRGLLGQEKYKEAIDALIQFNEIDSSNIEPITEIGRAYYILGEYSNALIWLEKGYKLDQNDQRVRRTLSLCYDRLRDWDKAVNLYWEECKFEPYVFSNWEKLINLYYRLNMEESAKECLNYIKEKHDESLEREMMIYKICLSFHWNDEAVNYLGNLTYKYGNKPEFFMHIIEMNLDSGNLTSAYHYLIKGRKCCKKSPKYDGLFNRFRLELNLVNLKEKDIKRSNKAGKEILKSEAAISNILRISKNIKPYSPRNSQRKAVIVSSTMGRGGAERQVVNCLNGLKSNPEYENVTLLCNAIDNSGGRIATYEPEIREMNIPILEYSNLEEWEGHFGDTSRELGIFENAFKQLPIKMQNAIRRLYFAFKEIKPDIVHAWQDQTNINVSIAAKMAGVPGIILFARSLRPDNKTMMHIRTRPYLKQAYRSILKDKNILFCHNSNAGKSSYSEWLELSGNNFSIIHNGIDFNDMEENTNDKQVSEILLEKGIDDESVVIGSVYRLVQEKRPFLWIDSISKVMEQHDNCHAILIGGGGLMEQVSEYIRGKDLQDKIHLIGQTRYVKSWLDKFDIFLLTSIVEGLPNVLIEAQAFGIPVITTNAGGASDTIIDGETGFVVKDDCENISQKIIECISDNDWLSRAKLASMQNSRMKFSTERMITNLIELYDKAVTNQRR
tara:strand:- start:174 stop:2801 length:2628 start_codon:yes stop_codon:yes gene_type:complete